MILFFLSSETFALELVHPLVFGRVYSVVISLYVLSNADQDANYRNKLEILNKKSDKALMSFYEVEPKFQPSFDANKVSLNRFGLEPALQNTSSHNAYLSLPGRSIFCCFSRRPLFPKTFLNFLEERLLLYKIGNLWLVEQI